MVCADGLSGERAESGDRRRARRVRAVLGRRRGPKEAENGHDPDAHAKRWVSGRAPWG